MILFSNLNLPADFDFFEISSEVAKRLKINPTEIISARLYKRSLDARKKDNIHYCCSVLLKVKGDQNKFIKKTNSKNLKPFSEEKYIFSSLKINSPIRPVIVGSGPSGIFAALTLSLRGLRPIILERGKRVDERMADVKNFWQNGILNKSSNVQFGEGGAGTFSDGKLNTGVNNPRCRAVIETFYKMGANENILYDSKPHIGTDVLVKVVKNLRREIEKNGGEFRFSNRLCDVTFKNDTLVEITVETETGSYKMPCDTLILCIGHSARDTFYMLHSKGVPMMQKPFSVGVRIEHPQSLINRSQYGNFADKDFLPAADYKLSAHLESGRGVYTFCMCPGGVVVNAASEQNSIVTNGMSYSSRNLENANSALLVGVGPDDFKSDSALAGIEFQREIEQRAFSVTGGYSAPAQRVGDFLNNKPTTRFGDISPSILPKATPSDIRDILPHFVTDSLKKGIEIFDKKLSGFSHPDAVITAPETRSSSPVRILRDDTFMSCIKGIFPCGEGAGYAGGIVSAAADGIRVAEAVLQGLNL